MSACEPLNPEVIRIWKKAFDLYIYDFYGQTDCMCSFKFSFYAN